MSTPNDLDAALTATTPAPETARTTAMVRRCRHQWHLDPSPTIWAASGKKQPFVCLRCGKVKDEQRSRKGKSARRRGNDYERDLAQMLGGTKVGHHGGPDDVRAGMFTVQSKVRKAFPSWMTDELAKLPRTDGRIPVLVVADAPGPGHRRRAIAVVTLDDWRDLHGA